MLEALRQVRELLRVRPRRPDLLIEYLHLIQDRYHYLSAAHLRAHLRRNASASSRGLRGRDVLFPFRRREGGGDSAAAHDHPRLQFHHLRAQGRGSFVRSALKAADEPDRRCACCARPAWADATPRRFAKLDIFTSITPRLESVEAALRSGDHEPEIPPLSKSGRAIWRQGGYSVLESCRSGRRDFDQIVKELTDAGLSAV